MAVDDSTRRPILDPAPLGLLAGQRALITGGAHGIGRAAAVRFAAEGARVAVLDVDADAAKATADEVGGIAVVADVRDFAATGAAVDEAAAALGGLTAVFANAGIGESIPVHTMTDDDFHRLVDANLGGTFATIRAAIPHLQAAGGGAIVTMSGTTGIRPARGEGVYGAAKAGIALLTKDIALSYAPAIRCNCVAPGITATRLTAGLLAHDVARQMVESRIPAGRVGHADEVACVASFLCSAYATYITGQTIVIEGGSLLPSHQTDELIKARQQQR